MTQEEVLHFLYAKSARLTDSQRISQRSGLQIRA